MEYLSSVQDKLKTIDESNIHYFNMLHFPEYFFGNVNFAGNTVDFCKIPTMAQYNMKNYNHVVQKVIHDYKSSTRGNRLRFKTDSKKIIIKIKLKRRFAYKNLNLCNSSGFDIYKIINNKYVYQEVIAPKDGENIFAEVIILSPSEGYCIFLPNYNQIEEFILGIEKGTGINPFNYPIGNQLPIIFYGNSITQGSAASKSGNSYPNIISRLMNRDIINLSTSLCCRGSDAMAKLIGQINCHSIIIDYTRNASVKEHLEENHEKFYKIIRQFHPDKKIILLTSSCFNNYAGYDDYDKIVTNTFKNAIKSNHNTFILNQKAVFDKSTFDYNTVDGCHYTDFGMYKIAKRISEILEE